MAMPRPMMVLRDRRDRFLLQQPPGHGHPPPPGPGCPPLHHPVNPYNLGPGHRFVEGEEEEFGRILPPPNVGWEGHQQQQQALAGALFRRRINMQQQQHHHHHPPILHQQQGLTGQQPPQEWDGPRPPVVNDVMRMRPPPVGLVGREPVAVDNEFLAGMRHREDLEMRNNSEHLKLAPRASHETEFLRNASRASHEKLIIEREQHLKNVYRASHEKLIGKEYMNKVSRGKPMENDRPLSDVPRPFHSPLQVIEGRSQVGHYGGGWEGRAHSDLVIRYGGRQAGRSQDLSPDASVPPGFQSVVMPSKRSREEETDFARFRPQRPRRVLTADSISPHQRPKEELDQSKLRSGTSRKPVPDDEEREEGQVTPPQPQPQKADPIGPPGFCKPEQEVSRRLFSKEDIDDVTTRGSVPEVYSPDLRGSNFAHLRSSPAQPKLNSGSSRTSADRDLGNELGVSARSSVRNIGTISTTRPSTGRAVGGDAGHIPRSAGVRTSGSDSPPRRSVSLAPPVVRAYGIDSPTRKPLTSRALGADAGPALKPSSKRASGTDLVPSSRPSTARTSSVDVGLGGEGHYKGEVVLVPKRERASPTPLRKEAEQLSVRQERVFGGGSLSPPEDPNTRRRIIKDSDTRSRQVEARVAERNFDSEQHRKRPYQDEVVTQGEQRPGTSSRKARLIPDSDGRPSRGPGLDDGLPLKKSARPSTSKESREAREISISKHGKRTMEGEESSKLRASVGSRSPINFSQFERGEARDAAEVMVKDVEVFSENRNKEPGRILSSAGRDKGPGTQSSKDALVSRSSSSYERFSFLPHQVKKEVIALSDKGEHEKQQRPSVLSRLSIPKPDSVPGSSSSTRLRTDTHSHQEKLVSEANDIVASVSKKASLAHVGNVGSQVNVHPVPERIERPARTQASDIRDLENKKTSTNLRTVYGKAAGGKVKATREELNSQLSARLLELQIPDGSKGEEERAQTRHTSVSISPNGIKNVYSPFQEGSDDLQRDSRSNNLQQPDTLQLRLDATPSIDVFTSAQTAVNSRELSITVEANEQGLNSRPAPKLIFTGHKSEQSPKDISPQVDSAAARESHVLTVPRIQEAQTSLEKSEERKVTVSKTVGHPAVGRLDVTESRNDIPVFRTSDQAVASEAVLTSLQLNLSNEKVKKTGAQVETTRKSSACPTSLSLSLSSSVLPASFIGERAEDFEFAQRKDISENLEKGEVRPQSSGQEKKKVELSIVSSAAHPSSSAPKEIRLFGATLTAPVMVMEPTDLSPEPTEVVKPTEPETVVKPVELETVIRPMQPETAPVSPTQEVPSPVVLPQTLESGAGAEPAETVKAPVETAAEVKKEPPASEKDLSEQSHDVQESAEAIPEVSQVQAQSSEPPLQEKPPVMVPATSKSTPAVVRPQSSARVSGPRTWVRSNATTGAPVGSVVGFRPPPIPGTSVMGHPTGRGRGIPGRGGAYVRKGNSLVRAPGAVTMPPPLPPAGMLGQVRPPPPVVNQGPNQKHPFFKNHLLPPPDSLKTSLPVPRKGLGPTVETVGGGLSVSKSVPVSSGGNLQGNAASLVEPAMSVTKSKMPPPVVPGVGTTVLKASPTVSAPTQLQSGTSSGPQTPVGDDVVNNPAKVATTTSQSNPGSSVSPSLGSNSMTYVRTKANQLVVAPCPASVESSVVENQAVKPDLYFKRKINQLVRNSDLKGNGSPSFIQVLLANEQPLKALKGERTRGSTHDKRTNLGRVLRQKKGPAGRSSFVWTLTGGTVSHGFSTTGRRPAASLFPWKRHSLAATSIRSRRVRSVPEGKKGSLLAVMSERLRRVRAVQPVYTRSADGFSLHRSGVLSVSGGNLKWTKSLEKRAKLASEVATKAVAAAESRKREEKQAVVEAAVKAKRAGRKVGKATGERVIWVGLHRYKMDAASKTLQRIPDTKGESETAVSSGPARSLPLLTPRRSYIGGTTYLRVGNQLVRDPKAASQALASEKVRWSLHYARSRGAKKQQYCQFFTRFGKCNKENGKCIYIHDPDKVAVCTKFLKGACSDEPCPLTHKIIPERMPDCSYFLEGLCTNVTCPYRHVNVNPKAPYCDGFLRGYCKDGDKCNKKHTYVCPTHAATGKCPDQSTCKLHHPKRKGKFELAISRKLGTKRKRRYFCSTETENRSKPERNKVSAAFSSSLPEEEIPLEDRKNASEDLAEFISLTNLEEQEGDAKVSPDTHKPWSFPSGVVPSFLKTSIEGDSGPAQEVERWIKPTFLLKATSPAS
ncbi:hypothetical protein R1sor_004811 [Riccia sorocarpa]|uniref:C3H1-type domain-containing protein n=1 Tax=Riccia sorocarpa TaxID=122646 RepID=A0ABD3HM44_9MARC